MKRICDLEVGDVITFGMHGMEWTVWTRTLGNVLNSVIQLKSTNHSFRTYSPKSKNWTKKVSLSRSLSDKEKKRRRDRWHGNE